MDARHKRTFRIGMLALCMMSSGALADTAEDMARANDLYDKEQMMDAAIIFKKLATQNYLPAQARLGELLEYTEVDEQAVGWFIMAAAQGDAAGAFGLGKMYLVGKGINKDIAQALFWIRYAAEKDHLDAVKMMEASYKKGPTSALGVPLDPKQAQYWEAKRIPLETAWQKSQDAKAQAFLKMMYEKQEARKKELKEAGKK